MLMRGGVNCYLISLPNTWDLSEEYYSTLKSVYEDATNEKPFILWIYYQGKCCLPTIVDAHYEEEYNRQIIECHLYGLESLPVLPFHSTDGGAIWIIP